MGPQNNKESETLSYRPLATSSAHKVFTLWEEDDCLISCLLRDVTYHLDLDLYASQPHGSGTPCLSVFPNLSHFLLLNVVTRLTFPVILSHTMPAHPLMCPHSLVDFCTVQIFYLLKGA